MTTASMMSETAYNLAADEVFGTIAWSLETLATQHDWDVEISRQGSVLEIVLPDLQKIIINKQQPWREIWVACKLGAAHFSFIDGRWFSERDKTDLATMLSRWMSLLLQHPCDIVVSR